MSTFPTGQRFPEGGAVALEREGADLSTSYVWTDWFSTSEWPRLAAVFALAWKVGSGVTNYKIKGQGRGATSDAVKDLVTALAGDTTNPAVPTTEWTITDDGSHEALANLQTTDHTGYDYVRFGFKITGGPGDTGDAAKVEKVQVMSP